VAQHDKKIWTKTRGGSWTELEQVPAAQWRAITSSSDGAVLAAAAWSGHIWRSDDGGVSWQQQAPGSDDGWAAITSSSDGTRLAAAEGSYGSVWMSVDSGKTWTRNSALPEKLCWRSISSSDDGSKLVATEGFESIGGNNMWISGDYGASWKMQRIDGLRAQNWSGVSISGDGTRVATVNYQTNGGWFHGDIWIANEHLAAKDILV